MTSGTLTGWGDYAGSVLNLSHQPSNAYYGMQEGFGANNKNSNYGYSADFFYTGTVNGASVSGTGDLFGDLDCTQPVTVTRTYTAADCAGNTTAFSYTVSVQSTSCLPTPAIPGPYEDENDGGTANGMSTEGHGITLTALQPNPALNYAILGFILNKEDQVAVQLYSMQGALIEEVYHGNVIAGNQQLVQFSVKELDPGMYTVVVMTSTERVTELLMVVQ